MTVPLDANYEVAIVGQLQYGIVRIQVVDTLSEGHEYIEHVTHRYNERFS
jgi:hypothetical protein